MRIVKLRSMKMRKLVNPKRDYFRRFIAKDELIPKRIRDKYQGRGTVQQTKITYPCVFTGRTRGVFVKRYKMSRHNFKTRGQRGKLHGVKKYTWA
mmetsp:Transcript_11857/g.17619  ORF Transcript_11857/g.17619 Transcript_11857/m.17619 type:complete len:95 (+) Transcript_11857:46-330(+)